MDKGSGERSDGHIIRAGVWCRDWIESRPVFTGAELICGEIRLFPMTAAVDNKSFTRQMSKRVKVTFREVWSRHSITVIKKMLHYGLF